MTTASCTFAVNADFALAVDATVSGVDADAGSLRVVYQRASGEGNKFATPWEALKQGEDYTTTALRFAPATDYSMSVEYAATADDTPSEICTGAVTSGSTGFDIFDAPDGEGGHYAPVVSGTPTFILNGTKVEGVSWPDVEAALKRAGA